jgi:hypothetical protein
VAEPLDNPLQETFTELLIIADKLVAGCAIVAVALAVQPLLSVTVTV